MKFENNKGNTKDTWETINELLNDGKKNDNPASLKVDDRIVVERKEIADVLSEYFSKILKSASEISYNDSSKIGEAFKDERGFGVNVNIAETNLEEMKQIIGLMKIKFVWE